MPAQIATTTYTHFQETASATWVIDHNLGNYPIIDVYVDFDATAGEDLQRVMPSSVVTNVNLNTCTVTFTNAVSGYATVA